MGRCVAVWLTVVLGLVGVDNRAEMAKGQGNSMDYGPLPLKFESYVAAAPTIVHGKIGSNQLKLAAAQSTPGVVIRVHDINVLEVLKSDKSIENGQVIAVSVFGGRLQVGDREFITSETDPRLKPGDDVILFLGYSQAERAFLLVYGSPSVLYVHDESVQIPNAIKDVSYLGGRRTISVLELAKAIRELGVKR